MTEIDQFESVFKAAAKPVFQYRPPRWDQALLVTDLAPQASEQLLEQVRAFLQVLGQTQWQILSGGELESVGKLLEVLQQRQPQLVCTYRNLHTQAWQWPYSLGDYVDVLVQHTEVPVLLIPHPQHSQFALPDNTDRVMVVTDHLTGDDQTVSAAASLTTPGGILVLTHIEDETIFRRYMEVISKIPEIDTETAQTTIHRQLLKEPADYIQSCQQGLEHLNGKLQVKSVVRMGQPLTEYRRLIEEHTADLLVFPATEPTMAAMAPLAYALAVEMRHLPLLLL